MMYSSGLTVAGSFSTMRVDFYRFCIRTLGTRNNFISHRPLFKFSSLHIRTIDLFTLLVFAYWQVKHSRYVLKNSLLFLDYFVYNKFDNRFYSLTVTRTILIIYKITCFYLNISKKRIYMVAIMVI